MTDTATTTALDLVLQYHRAWTANDIEAAMALVSDDIVCHSPGGDIVGKDAYREYIAGFAPMLTGIVDVTSLADGDHVILFYYPQTAATQTTVAAERFTLAGGLITETLLAFDRLSYAPPQQ